uniref:Uncharacterized protein n=1 Tax=Magallana gigas TaxID=29159 RepID=K1QDE2_MAGGI
MDPRICFGNEALSSMNTESKKRLVNQIHEDLWTERRIRNPQKARKMMSYHRKKQDENECFVPRKLFLFNIDTFVCPPMPQCEPQKPKNEEAFVEPKDDSWQTICKADYVLD